MKNRFKVVTVDIEKKQIGLNEVFSEDSEYMKIIEHEELDGLYRFHSFIPIGNDVPALLFERINTKTNRLLSDDDRDLILDLIENAPEPNENLLKLRSKFAKRKWIQGIPEKPIQGMLYCFEVAACVGYTNYYRYDPDESTELPWVQRDNKIRVGAPCPGFTISRHYLVNEGAWDSFFKSEDSVSKDFVEADKE